MNKIFLFYLTPLQARLAECVKTWQNFGRDKGSEADGTLGVGTGEGAPAKWRRRKTYQERKFMKKQSAIMTSFNVKCQQIIIKQGTLFIINFLLSLTIDSLN